MTEYGIKWYDNFNTKGCPDELIFGKLNYQPIPYFLNNDDDNGNNVPGTPVDNALPDNKVVECTVVPNDEYINDEIIIIYYDENLASDINPLQN